MHLLLFRDRDPKGQISICFTLVACAREGRYSFVYLLLRQGATPLPRQGSSLAQRQGTKGLLLLRRGLQSKDRIFKFKEIVKKGEVSKKETGSKGGPYDRSE
jgi:hypothetical protein